MIWYGMTLLEWLKQENLTAKDFAENNSIPYGSVLKWVYSDRFPRINYLDKIYNITKGKVTANDFQKIQEYSNRS